MPWAAAVAAVGAIGGAAIASSGAKSAANTQAQSTEAGIAEQQRQYDQNRADQAPYRAGGTAALAQYNRLMGIGTGVDHSEANFDAAKYLALNPDANEYMRTSGNSAYQHYLDDGSRRTGDFWTTPDSASGSSSPDYGSYARPLTASEVQLDPGYQFGQQQGQEAIDRKAAAAGGRISGAALKAASEYNTNYATTGYSTAYNRANQARSDRLNRLAALAGIGQTATQQTGTAGTAAANQISAMTTAQGNASAAGQLAQGNIWSGAGNQLAALYGRSGGTGLGGVQAGFSQTDAGSAGFGTGVAYGNQDYGAYI